MKTIVDYLNKNKKCKLNDIELEIENIYDDKKLITLKYRIYEWWIAVTPDKDIENIIQDILEDHGVEIRFCEVCGKPFNAGFIAEDGDWYCCEECFEPTMDKNYGKDRWRATDDEGEYGGFYEYLKDEWEDTGIYWTEWN